LSQGRFSLAQGSAGLIQSHAIEQSVATYIVGSGRYGNLVRQL
jgi:hypothetical protein